MRTARAFGAWFLVILGAMLIVAWAMASRTVESIDDGTAADELVATVMRDPATAELLADRVDRALDERVEGPAATLALALVGDRVHDAVVSIASSPVPTGSRTGCSRRSRTPIATPRPSSSRWTSAPGCRSGSTTGRCSPPSRPTSASR